MIKVNRRFMLALFGLGLLGYIIYLGLFFTGQKSITGLNDFNSDGCTLFIDESLIENKSWCDCCLEHDKAYWRGGTEEERLEADRVLRDCVLKKTGDSNLANLMFQGVRVGGGPYFPNWYRWGYGWNFNFSYRRLTKEEELTAREKLDQYNKTNPEGACH